MSLLKTNEIQNYNGSSLTLTASTVSTSAQLNTGGNISVTGSLNVSDDSTTRTNLGLGTIATQDSDSITVTGGTATLGALTVSGSDSGDLVRITQTGSGNALVVEDSANPDSTPFVVDNSGSVGIGTSSLSEKLTVNGNIYAAGNVDVRNSAGNQGVSLTTDGNIEITRTNGDPFIDFKSALAEDFDCRIQQNSDGLTFQTGGNGSVAERMRIDSSGNIVIGNNGTFSETAVNIQLSQSLGQIYCASNDVDAGIFYRPTSGTGNGVILTKSDVGGTNTLVGVGYANGTFGQVSDATTKKNITDARNYLDDIKRIRVVKYNWITDEEDTPKEIGWIAQEVEEIFPGMVDEKEGSKLLKKEVFLPMLMKCVQEQQTLIESQQSQIDELTARIVDLETT